MYKKNGTFNVNAKASTELSYKSSNTKIVTVDCNGKVTIKGKGTAKITITAAESSEFESAEKVITVKILSAKMKQTITASNVVTIYSPNRSVWVKASGKGTLKYSISNKNIATVSSSGKITVKRPGRTVLMISSNGTDIYKGAKKRIVVTVRPAANAFSKCVSSSSRTASLKWKKDNYASGYELQRATNKNFVGYEYARAGKNQTTTTMRRLKSKSRYYFRIRSYVKLSNGYLYGPWSSVKSVTIK